MKLLHTAFATLLVASSALAFANKPFLNYDQQLMQIAEKHPEFAGIYRNSLGEFTVAIKDQQLDKELRNRKILQMESQPQQIQPLLSTLKQTFGETIPSLKALTPAKAGATTDAREDYRVELVNYSFAQLYNWYTSVTADLFAMDNIVMTDISEDKNKITVAVQTGTPTDAVFYFLKSRGIPDNAINIESMDAVADTVSVRDRVRPIQGGLEIRMSTGGICSLGFVARLTNGDTGFVTASHCTQRKGLPDGTTFTQGGDNVGGVAVEALRMACPGGGAANCLRADAAFVRFPGTFVNNVDYKDAVLKTKGRNNLDLKEGAVRYRTWWRLRIAGTTADLMGETVFKTGRTTGTTSATVDATCVDYNSGGTRQLCHSRVNSGSFGNSGDSGSPVLSHTYYSHGRSARVAGIFVAGNSSVGFISNIDGIQAELGILDVSF